MGRAVREEPIVGTRRVVATAGVLGGTFLAAIETTVVAAAMPTVADQLGGLSLYSWVFSAYLLASTVSIPLWGSSPICMGDVGSISGVSACFSWGQPCPGRRRPCRSSSCFGLYRGSAPGG